MTHKMMYSQLTDHILVFCSLICLNGFAYSGSFPRIRIDQIIEDNIKQLDGVMMVLKLDPARLPNLTESFGILDFITQINVTNLSVSGLSRVNAVKNFVFENVNSEARVSGMIHYKKLHARCNYRMVMKTGNNIKLLWDHGNINVTLHHVVAEVSTFVNITTKKLYRTKARLSKIKDITVDGIMNANYFNEIRTVLNFILVDLVNPIQRSMERPIDRLTQKTTAYINKNNLISRLPLDQIVDYELTSTCDDSAEKETGPELDPKCDLLIRRKRKSNSKKD